MGLDAVFLHFLPRFDAITIPRSIAEVGVTGGEVTFLQNWFAEQYALKNLYERTWQEDLGANGVKASCQEMLGVVFLMFGSEVCREDSDEEAVWPGIRSRLSGNKVAYSVLFDASGQPTVACKEAIAAGSRRLNLRNVIDCYGSMEYFETLKLQFGFTFRGAVRRLPDWLDGLGPPTAVQILTDTHPDFEGWHLSSESFTALWRNLREYRRGNLDEGEAHHRLKSSPWIRPAWIPDLLEAARKRRRSGAAQGAEAVESVEDESICSPRLQWEHPSPPCLVLALNETKVTEILAGHESAAFSIDGRIVDRWILQEDGSWKGRRELPCQQAGSQQPNLRPKLLSISSRDSSLEEIDLVEVGLGEPLLIFDVATGRQCELDGRLLPSRSYALLHDRDMAATHSYAYQTKERRATLLSSPWDHDLRVTHGDALFWEPRLATPSKLPPTVTLRSVSKDEVRLGTEVILEAEGIPDGSTSVELSAGGVTRELSPAGDHWQTKQALPVTLPMVIGEDRVRLRIANADSKRSVIAKLGLTVEGIARMEPPSDFEEAQWVLHPAEHTLNRAGGAGKIRVFAHDRNYDLYEGSRYIGKLGNGIKWATELCGWGEPLILDRKELGDLVLVNSVEDRGCVSKYAPSMLGKEINSLLRRTPQTPNSDYAVWVWDAIQHPPHITSGPTIRSEDDGFMWQLPPYRHVSALAIVYEGICLGSYWHTNSIQVSIREGVSPAVFALFRWLKLPVLSESLRAGFSAAAAGSPAAFLKGWLSSGQLPTGIVQRSAEQGLDTVVRSVLWYYSERQESRINEIVELLLPQRDPGATDGERFKRGLKAASETCPSLAWAYAKARLRGGPYKRYVRSVLTELVQSRSPDSTPRAELDRMIRDCAVLVGTTPDSLNESIKRYQKCLESRARLDVPTERLLRRLGERHIGRRFMSSFFLNSLLEGFNR